MRKRIAVWAALTMFSAMLQGTAFAQTLKIESARLDAPAAASTKDREGDSRAADLKCPEGARFTRLEAQGSTWGTYPSITWVRITCTLVDGHRTNPEAGIKRTPNVMHDMINPAIGACNEADGGFGGREANLGDYMTGLRVVDDHYSKDLRIQCGNAKIDVAAQTFKIERRKLGIDWLLLASHKQGNDRTLTVECADDEVMTGLKLRYRVDRNEAAFTYFQPFCSRVTVRSR